VTGQPIQESVGRRVITCPGEPTVRSRRASAENDGPLLRTLTGINYTASGLQSRTADGCSRSSSTRRSSQRRSGQWWGNGALGNGVRPLGPHEHIFEGAKDNTAGSVVNARLERSPAGHCAQRDRCRRSCYGSATSLIHSPWLVVEPAGPCVDPQICLSLMDERRCSPAPVETAG
jgi:hypothetical protein